MYRVNIIISYEIEDEDASNVDEAVNIAEEMFHCDTHHYYDISVEQVEKEVK